MSSKSKISVSSSSRSKSRSSKVDFSEDEEETMKQPDQFAWKILSQDNVSKFKKLSPEDLTNEMAKVLSLHKFKEDLKQAAILDFYVTAFVFSQESSFTDEQISSFFTLQHKLIENIKDKHLSLADNMVQLQKYLGGIGIPKQQTSLKCFTLEIAQTCLNYIYTTLVQHYSLFEYLFEEKQEDDIIQANYIMCLPPDLTTHCPAPLEEAVTEDFYNTFIDPLPPPSPEIEEQESDTSMLLNAVGLNVTSQDIKTFMKEMTTTAISSYKEELALKLKERETLYLAKLAKVDKEVK